MFMGMIKNLVGEIGGIIGSLSISSKEKKELETEVVQTVYRYVGELAAGQTDIVKSETQGNWLQRSWRPLMMLSFAFVVLLGTIVDIPFLSDDSKFWNLIETGLGGYVIGRSLEGLNRWLPGMKKKVKNQN